MWRLCASLDVRECMSAHVEAVYVQNFTDEPSPVLEARGDAGELHAMSGLNYLSAKQITEHHMYIIYN